MTKTESRFVADVRRRILKCWKVRAKEDPSAPKDHYKTWESYRLTELVLKLDGLKIKGEPK